MSCVAIQQALKRKKGQISSDSDSEQQAGLYNFERQTVMQKISRTIGVSIFAHPFQSPGFPNRWKKGCGPTPGGCCQGQGQGSRQGESREDGGFGVCQILSKNGAYMGIPVHHKIATKMGDHDPTDIINTDIVVLHFQTKLCILMYF
jgi:hypothetical protein